MIHILWPTIRPQMMMDTYRHWEKNADDVSQIVLKVGVNTEEQKSQITIPSAIVYVVGEKRGLTTAVNVLSNSVDGDDNDIVILASDDFYAPKSWDTWVRDALRDKTGCLHVNDGYVKQVSITIPIMSLKCLKCLNNIIYHPSYIHQYSDTELYQNLQDLELIIDKWTDSPVFEHKNWANKKRKPDQHDKYNMAIVETDGANWCSRKELPVAERLKK
jgi:hypothetical protein